MIRALRSFPANKSSMTTTTTEIHSINFHLDCRCCVFPLITAESQQLPLLNLLQRNLPGDFKQSSVLRTRGTIFLTRGTFYLNVVAHSSICTLNQELTLR